MLDRLTEQLQFQGRALALRSERQKVLAANIANADTPNYQARDVDFAQAMRNAMSASGEGAAATAGGTLPLSRPQASGAAPQPGHLRIDDSRLGPDADPVQAAAAAAQRFRLPDQAAMDGNTVDLDRERANFADNAVSYEATLKFINGSVRSILSAIRGE